jgi:hypothetical protein
MRSEIGFKTIVALARVRVSLAKPRVLANAATSAAYCLLTLIVTHATIGAEALDPISARLVISPAPARPISFVRDVSSALTKAGCNAGVCHGSFQGRDGLRLSLLGFDPDFDHEVQTKASRRRRVVPTAPESSLLLRKPVGEIPHGGGRRISRDSEVFAILRNWQLAGMPDPRDGELMGLKLTAQPSDVTLMPNQSQTLTVQATFADGETRDVTSWALFEVRESHIAEVSRTGRVTAQRAGTTAVMVRYLGQSATVSVAVPFSAEPLAMEFQPANFLDELVFAEWQRMRVRPVPLASDEEFLRRVGLDLIGTLPTPDELRACLADTSINKRAKWIDGLLARPEYVDCWAMRWDDLLRSHRRYLGAKGLASFTGWLKQSLRDNKPLDVMTRELLTTQGNLYANGAVGYFFIDEKVEDLHATNPAAVPAVLDRLARELTEHNFDAKHVLRVICNARVYQLAGELQFSRDPDGQLCTHQVPRRMSAEVLLDAASQETGVPEAFDGQPVGTRAIALVDPSFVSTFLTTFGRPLRNNACDCARAANPDLSQALHLVNSTTLPQKVVGDNGRLATSLNANKLEAEVLDELYLATLSRRPRPDELSSIDELLREAPSRAEGLQDLLWALLNSSEFVFNH